MGAIEEHEQRLRGIVDRIYATFLLEVKVLPEDYEYLAVRCAQRILNGVEASLRVGILRREAAVACPHCGEFLRPSERIKHECEIANLARLRSG